MHNILSQIIRLLFPSCCALCQLRQRDAICEACILKLRNQSIHMRCIICGRPHQTWVCKSCQYAKWSFDQSLVLCDESSRLIPFIKDCDEYGQIKHLPAIFYAWLVLNFRKMPPVDLLIPLPELFSMSKARGFWFALILVKKWSRLTRTPYNKDLIGIEATASQCGEMNIASYYLKPRYLSADLLQNKRIVIVMPLMQSKYVLHLLASQLKSHGVRWVAYWSLTRKT